MRFLPAILVFGAAGAGYVMTHGELPSQISASWISDEGDPEQPADEFAADLGEPSQEAQLTSTREDLPATRAEKSPARPAVERREFSDVFRFDFTPQSITERWSRVSTGMSDMRYLGYRVPLITGDARGDLAGTLTYYFDSQPRLRRIAFLGATDDPERIIDFVTRQYGLRRYNTGNPRVTTFRSRYRYTGLLQVTPADVLNSKQSSPNYQIELSLER